MIIIPGGVLSVEDACSGQRYLLAALILGALYSYVNYTSIKVRIMVVLVSAAAAFFANTLRVVIVVYLGYASNMQHPLVSDHMTLGWYLFAGLVIIMLFIDSKVWRYYSAKIGVRNTEKKVGRPLKCKSLIAPALLAVLAVVSGPLIVHVRAPASSGDEAVAGVLQLPAGKRGWQGPMDSTVNWEPAYIGAISAKKDYQIQGGRITLYVAYYTNQHQDSELINVDNKIADTDVWDEEYIQPYTRRFGHFSVLEQRLRGNNEERIVWYWYNIGGWTTTNFYAAKFLQLASYFLGRTEAYMVAVSAAVKTDVPAARRVLEIFIDDMRHPLKNIHLLKEDS